MEAGWIGVDLFFVLSGFLISGLLFADIQQLGRVRIGRFLVRRGFKIYPPLIVFLGLTSLLSPGLRKILWVQVCFLQSYVVPQQGIWQPTWSLAVEEHFYLTLPFVLAALCSKKRLSVIPWMSLALVVTCFLLRLTTKTYVQLWQTHLRVDSLFAGVTLGWLYHFRRGDFLRLSFKFWVPLAAFGIPALSVGLIMWAPDNTLRASSVITINLLGFAALVLWAVPRNLSCNWLADIGRYSYSIYLWHMTAVVALIFRQQETPSIWKFVACVLLSLAIGVTMSVLVEWPALRLRERLFASTKTPTDGAVQLRGPIPAPVETCTASQS